MSSDRILGLDLLGVVIERGHHDHQAPQAPSLVPGAIESLTALHYAGLYRILLFAPPADVARGATDVSTWLEVNRIFEKTGLQKSDVIVTPHGHYLVTLCRRLHVTQLVSDRAEILRALIPDITAYFFSPSGIPPGVDTTGMIVVPSWDTLVHRLIAP